MKVAEPSYTLFGDVDVTTPTSGEGVLGPVLSPNEASYRLDRLRDAWNQLYNDVWPGLAHVSDVPPEVAELVAHRYAAWRVWYEEYLDKPWDVIDMHLGSPFARGLADWTEEYGHLRERVLGAGAPTYAPPLAPLRGRDLLPRWLWPTAAVGLFALGALWVVRKTPQPRRTPRYNT